MSGETLTEAEMALSEYASFTNRPLFDQAAVERILTDRTAALTADLAAARAELDAARAQVAAVDALHAEWRKRAQDSMSYVWATRASELRAALDQPGQAVARIKADAWEEGVEWGRHCDVFGDDGTMHASNPYRADAIEREAGQ